MTNHFAEIERLAWEQMNEFAGEREKALYRHDEHIIAVDAVPLSPVANGFVFNGFSLYESSHVFEISKNELKGLMPKEGDTITIGGIIYPICTANSGPCWIDIGSFGISIQIHTTLQR